MKEYNNFKITIDGHVAQVSFDRPSKSNSLHMEAWTEMKDLFSDLNNHEEVRVIILSGEGKNFCAGIDLELLMNLNQHNHIHCEGRKRENIRNFIQTLQDCISAIERCRKPVIAAIHRACIGGGVDIITACDMRFCTQDAYFTIKEVDMGLVADIGTLQRLPKILQPGMVAELAYTGRNLYGKEACQIGLVNKVFENKEEMIDEVLMLARTIAKKSPLVIRGTKEIIQYSRDHSVEESLKYMATFNAAFLMSDDLLEAFESFISKKEPNFNN